MLKSLFKAIAVTGLCLTAVGSLSAVERQSEVQEMNIPVSSAGHNFPMLFQSETSVRIGSSNEMLLAAESCLAECDRESRACDKEHIDDDGSRGDVCEQAYIQCERKCGG